MNKEQLIRVTNYYRALIKLRAIGLERVFAHNLADAAGVTATVVRKDFSQLSILGQKRGGYQIVGLIESLSTILGKGDEQNAIILGCGRIGLALMHYSGFESDGINIVAGFDNDSNVYSDPSQPTPIYPTNRLEEVIRALKVKVAIITVPESSAADTYRKILDADVAGVLNFSPVTLKPTLMKNGTMSIVHNINVGLSLEQIFYELKFPKKKNVAPLHESLIEAN
ncbi:MAG: redox-sensing transcriptional repressor Rex [Spirochaetaceae bacterium]|nr:redox-sensing transcriptional repressor Rex [Spirochaetaceae bacterium]